MINKKLDYSFEALYRLKKKNLLTQTGKGKNPTYSSEQIILSKQSGLDDILTNITSVNRSKLETWIKNDSSSFQTFITPGPMAPDGLGNFYIGNLYSPTSQVTKVDSNGKFLSYYQPPPGIVTGSADGWPWGLAYYNGVLYAADMGRNFIYKLLPSALPQTWELLLGLPGTSGFINGVGGPSTLTRLFSPVGILPDGLGNLYICQGDNHAISKYVISTNTITTFAGTGVLGVTDGPRTSAQFRVPVSLFFDNLGDIIICDNYNNRIRKINITTGIVSTVSGSVAGTQDGPVATATFVNPTAGCCDLNGNLYIASSVSAAPGFQRTNIRKISNGIVSTIFNVGVELPPDSDITHLYFYQGYVYVSEQSTSNTYRFKV